MPRDFEIVGQYLPIRANFNEASKICTKSHWCTRQICDFCLLIQLFNQISFGRVHSQRVVCTFA